MTARFIQGDARAVLPTLPAQSVHAICTSPPYWGLRRYAGDQAGMIGNEDTPAQWVETLVAVFREVRRVLRDDGTLWLNVGDKFNSPGPNNHGKSKVVQRGLTENWEQVSVPSLTDGYKPKDLIGLPWLLAFALRADGWWLRSEIIWHKVNPMPQSVTDRPATAHEQLFLLTKRPRYYYDAYAVREPGGDRGWAGSRFDDGATLALHPDVGKAKRIELPGRNARSVQAFASSPFSVQRLGKYGSTPATEHYAVFPVSLPTWCIRAGTSEKGVCAACGAPWSRQVKTSQEFLSEHLGGQHRGDANRDPGTRTDVPTQRTRRVDTTVGWLPSCEHAAQSVPATVLDCFSGAGTTVLAAERLGRDSIGIELSPSYIKLAEARLRDAAPLLEGAP